MPTYDDAPRLGTLQRSCASTPNLKENNFRLFVPRDAVRERSMRINVIRTCARH